jgi:hypothetical protein
MMSIQNSFEHKHLLPPENIEIYCLLFVIETALRELIIHYLSEQFGPRWYIHRLPPDVLAKYRSSINMEKNIRWYQLIPHHPIYYIDFPDLRKIIEQKDNWNDVFKNIFPRKDVIINTLSELEFIRNKIAHNRKTGTGDLKITAGSYSKLENTIGTIQFEDFSTKCSCALDIPERLSALTLEIENTYKNCMNCLIISGLPEWEYVNQQWWFDESYLIHPINSISAFYSMINNYNSLPHTRGSGYKIEQWVRSSNLEVLYTDALQQLDLFNTEKEMVNGYKPIT